MEEPKRSWKESLPAILIVGSPLAAAGMAHSVALIGHFFLPNEDWITVGAAIMLRLNLLLAIVGTAAGALRVSGTVPTRIAVVIASVIFAAVVYLGTIGLTFTFIPGYADRYGID